MRRGRALRILAALMALSPELGCKRIEPGAIDPVRALARGVDPRFRTPTDARLTDEQIAMYLRVRTARVNVSDAEAARKASVDPSEFDWVRARVLEALGVLEARRVADGAFEGYGRGLAALREARKAAADKATASRLDAEIATLERERASLKRPEPVPPAVAANAARIAPRRAEIEALGP